MFTRTSLRYFESQEPTRADQVAKLHLDRGDGHKLIQQHASRELAAFRQTHDAHVASPGKVTRKAHHDAMNALGYKAHDLLGGSKGYHPQADEHVAKALERQSRQSREHHVRHLVAWASSGDAHHNPAHPLHHEIAKHDLGAVTKAVRHHYPDAKIEPVKGSESSDPSIRHMRVSFNDEHHESFVIELPALNEWRTLTRSSLAFKG